MRRRILFRGNPHSVRLKEAPSIPDPRLSPIAPKSPNDVEANRAVVVGERGCLLQASPPFAIYRAARPCARRATGRKVSYLRFERKCSHVGNAPLAIRLEGFPAPWGSYLALRIGDPILQHKGMGDRGGGGGGVGGRGFYPPTRKGFIVMGSSVRIPTLLMSSPEWARLPTRGISTCARRMACRRAPRNAQMEKRIALAERREWRAAPYPPLPSPAIRGML